jgi:hypothetical protein
MTTIIGLQLPAAIRLSRMSSRVPDQPVVLAAARAEMSTG